jgi:hypothetical protein
MKSINDMETNPNCSETYASLRLVGASIDPGAITRALGIQPTFQIHVGDVLPKGTRPRSEGIWAVSTEGRVRSSALEDHILALLQDLPSEFRSFIPENCRCEIQCVWRSATGYGGPSLSARLLSRLGGHGIDLDFDFYSDV